jgi:hypothetical protein
MSSSSIVIDTGSGCIILDHTPENFHVAYVLASQPVYLSNGEWDDSKQVYANTGGGKVNIAIKHVRIVSGVEQMSKAKADADSDRWKADAEKNAAIKERDEISKARIDLEKQNAELREEIKRINEAMIAAGVSVSYSKRD